MKSFKLFNADRLPSPIHQDHKVYAIVFSDLMPEIKVPKMPGIQPDQQLITVQINGTLCDPKVGLYGRTSSVKFGGDEKDIKGAPVPV